MARKPMVTRNEKATVCTVLCMNTETKQAETHNLTVYGNFKTDKSLNEAVKEILEDDNVKVVTVKAENQYLQLFGMDIKEFIKMAVKLPPRNANETNEKNEF